MCSMRLAGLAALALLLGSAAAVDVPIKIVKAKPTPKAASWEPAVPVASRDPMPFSGPDVFRPLVGQCWTTTSGGYEYKLCPYRNVTQKAVGRSHNIFHGILGYVYSMLADVAVIALLFEQHSHSLLPAAFGLAGKSTKLQASMFHNCTLTAQSVQTKASEKSR